MANRKLKTGIEEHIADIKYKKTSALARLCNKEPLLINFKCSRIICSSRFYLPSIIRETTENLHSDNISNIQFSIELLTFKKEIPYRIMK